MNRTRILVVDDDLTATRLVKVGLERTGAYEVREENSAGRALAAAHEFRPDLILLDVVMPHLDGGDIASRLQRDPALAATPIMFLTSLVSEADAARFPLRTAGCRVLPKPVSTVHLIAAIEDVLHHGSPAKTPAATD